jgi:hypothetical protein
MRAEGRTPINATEGGAHVPGWDDIALAEVFAGRMPLGIAARVEDLLARQPTDAAKVHAALTRELRAAERILAHCARVGEILASDPDGDLTLDADSADEMLAINAAVRTALHEAPLCSEAVFAPIEDLRAANSITAHTFYDGLVRPLRELSEQLARLLQHPDLSTTVAEVRATG